MRGENLLWYQHMSDETPPPALRLKPRVRPEPEAPAGPPPDAAPASPAPTELGATPSPSEESHAELRLKPKLSAADSAPASEVPERVRLKPKMHVEATESAPSALVQPPAPVAPAPEASHVPAETADEEAPKFKLKAKPLVTTGAALPPPGMPPAPQATPEAPAAKSALPPPFPVVKPATGAKPALPPPVPHMRAPADKQEAELQPPSPPPPPIFRRLTKWPYIVAAVLLLSGGFFVFYHVYLDAPPPPPVVRKNPSAKPAASSTTSASATTVTQAKSDVPLPGQELIDAGQSAVTARRAKEQARIDALLTGQDISQTPQQTPAPAVTAAPAARPPKPPVQTSATTTIDIAPGIKVTTSSLMTAGAAGAPFRSFVGNAKISGVFQGSPVKVIINGSLYRAGDLISPGLGIRFVGINVSAKTILFRDDSGATVSRKY